MPSVTTFFLSFLLASLFVLVLVIGIKAPELLRSYRRFLLQMEARKTRGARMLADLDKLKADARKLEGVYRFESPDHQAPDYGSAERAVSAPVGSRTSFR